MLRIPSLCKRHPRHLLRELRVRLQQDAPLKLKLVDLLLHLFELLRHLIALRDASLELLADVNDHFGCPLQFLFSIVRCAGSRICALGGCNLFFEMGCKLVVGAHKLTDAREFQQILSQRGYRLVHACEFFARLFHFSGDLLRLLLEDSIVG